MKLCAGAGIATIEPLLELLPLEQFTSIHDELHVRVLYLQGAINQCIVSWELTSMRDYEIERCKRLLMERYDLSYDAIWICVTHTFLAPHTRSKQACQNQEIYKKNKRYCACLETALITACDKAVAAVQEVTVSYGKDITACININRDIPTDQGWWLGQNPQGYCDHSIQTLAFWTMDQRLLASLTTCDVSSSVLEHVKTCDGTRVISADFIGVASKQLETNYPDAIAIFLMGAAGNQTTIEKAADIESGFELIETLGESFANAIKQTLEQSQPIQFDPMVQLKQSVKVLGQQPLQLQDLQPCKQYSFICDKDQTVIYELWIFGELVMIALQPELYSESAGWLKEHSPYSITLVITMVNGGAKYMAPKEAYELITYEAMNSHYAKGACEQVLETIVEQLRLLKQKEGQI